MSTHGNYSTWLTTPMVVVHTHVALLECFKANVNPFSGDESVRKWKWKESAHTIAQISGKMGVGALGVGPLPWHY